MSPMNDNQLTCSLLLVYNRMITNDFSDVSSVAETRLPCSSDGPFASPIVEWDTIFSLKGIKTVEGTDDDKIIALNDNELSNLKVAVDIMTNLHNERSTG
jgi:predicted GH43/DUF377 family glycosyl hydrolase